MTKPLSHKIEMADDLRCTACGAEYKLVDGAYDNIAESACREVIAILEPIASGPNRIAIYHIEDALAAARKGVGE
jgi:hypothetical protein